MWKFIKIRHGIRSLTASHICRAAALANISLPFRSGALSWLLSFVSLDHPESLESAWKESWRLVLISCLGSRQIKGVGAISARALNVFSSFGGRMCCNSWWRQREFRPRAAKGLQIPLEGKQDLGFAYRDLNCFLHEDALGSPPWFQGGETAPGWNPGSVLPLVDSKIQRVNFCSTFDQGLISEGHKPFTKLGWIWQAPFAKKTNKTNNPSTGGSF